MHLHVRFRPCAWIFKIGPYVSQSNSLQITHRNSCLLHVSAVVLFADVFLQDTGVNVCWLQRAVNIMTCKGNRGREREREKKVEESERGG